ncbi:MAG: hypothetical protein J0L58_05735 [Burkholderiales bacterium]|nr:hypothetical protein [Burkholderiales bacterium]
MLRCALLIAALASPFAATPQVARPFPADALRAELQVLAAPDVLIAGKPARLSPGARIRGENNLLAMPGELVGKRLLVHYTREADGFVKDIWVLNAAERAIKVWPNTPEQAARWQFDMATQTWSKP